MNRHCKILKFRIILQDCGWIWIAPALRRAPDIVAPNRKSDIFAAEPEERRYQKKCGARRPLKSVALFAVAFSMATAA